MSGWGQVLNTDPDDVLDISRLPRRRHSPRATSCRNHGLPRSRIPHLGRRRHDAALNHRTLDQPTTPTHGGEDVGDLCGGSRAVVG
jgi:hypothetical protein